MKEPINIGDLDPQQRLDVARGVDDSARLPVVAAAKALCKHHAEVCGVNADDQWTNYSEDFLADVQIVMPHLQADAKALLAEKDARIHQIETERDVFMDARQYQIDEIGVVRAQLQAAQARGAVVLPGELKAPAGGEWGYGFKRGYEAYKREFIRLNPSAQDGHTGEVITEHSGCGQGVQIDRLSVRLWPGDRVVIVRAKVGTAMSAPTRLNPAPATADSDVREVK